jgi:hypothetical protein
MPNISAGAFIRGNSVAWTSGAASGGADTVTIGANNLPVHTHADTFALGGTTSFGSATHTHTGPSHTHAAGTLAGPSHTHTSAAHTHTFTTGAGSSHSHNVGTLQFAVAYLDVGGGGTNSLNFYNSGHGLVTNISATNQGDLYGTNSRARWYLPVGAASTDVCTYNGTGATATEASHTHTGTSDSTTPGATGSSGTGSVTGSTAADGTGATGAPSATATVTLSGAVGNNTTTGTAIATLPVYFNAVFYMRVR